MEVPEEPVIGIRRSTHDGRTEPGSAHASPAGGRAEGAKGLAELLDDLDRELGALDREDLAWADWALGSG
ncbi:MAG: toxin-antitoxin system antitoxin subunit [Solirubrobacteraceae bacterium]